MGLLSIAGSIIWRTLSRVARWLAPRNLLVLCIPLETPGGGFVVPVGTADGIKEHRVSSKEEADDLYCVLLSSAYTSIAGLPLELHVIDGCGSYAEFEEAFRAIQEPRRPD